MGKQGAELRWWDQSSSSTVLLDPAALVESCKQQIQGKDGIPAEHQRLIFACRVANQEVLSYTCKRSSRCAGVEENVVSEFLKELRGWEAILKDDNHNIAKLLHPLVRAEEQVAAEDERKASQLSCQTARELRSMGIPCNVYYLFFDKWIPASLKNGKCCEVTRNVEIQIDKDFQARSFEILLFGRLNGISLPEPFVFRMNGGEVAAQVSMLEQMARYRQDQKTRHRLGLSTQSVGKGVEGRDVHTSVVENDGLRQGNGCEKSEHADDYYCPCGKGLDFTVVISNDHQLKCFVLKVIQVPDSGRKQEQLASQAPGRCDRGNSNNDSNKYCVSSSGGTSRKCENTVSENKVALAESSLRTQCCEFAKTSSSLPLKVSDPSGSSPCPSDVPCPIYSSQSSTSDLGATPQNVYISSTESGPEEGLPIVEEPAGTLSKKKKKRKAKRKGKVGVEICSSLDSTPGVSTINESLDSCTHTPVVECHSGGCETTCYSGSGGDGALDSPLMEDVVRELSTCGDKLEGGLVNIFRREALCAEHSREDCGSRSMMRTEAMKIGLSSLTAEEIVAEMVSDQLSMTLSKESSKCCFAKSTVLRHGEDFLPAGRGIPWSAACLGTGSFENNLSQPFVGPIMVEMSLQKSSGISARSSGDSRGSNFPSRELVGSLETVRDANTLLDFSDTQFSARGGYNGSSGTGSRNGRSGADGNGNRSQGRGSEDNRKGNTSGYHGGGQGSSSSNHGGGPGGSSTSGSSGGSGGGNWNRGGGRGSSGGSWDSRRSDDDGGNTNKEGDNDERYRNSFQSGSNGDAAADSVARKKGISSLDSHGRKGASGGVTGDQLMNGTSNSHGPLATSSSSGKENIESWDDLAHESVPPTQYKTGAEDGAPRTRTDQKFGPPYSHMNGFLHHDLPPTKESNLIEKRDGVDNYQHGRASNALAQDSFVKVLKHSITNNSQHKDDDYDYLCSSSSRGSSKENRSFGTTVPPGQQDSLKGAWQKKICWDDQRPQPSYSNNNYVSEGSSQVGLSKGKLSLKSTRNGIQIRGSQSSESDIVSSTRSSSAPSTPNGPIHSHDSFSDIRELNNNYTTRQTDGHAYQSTAVQAMKIAGEQQGPQARMQAANTTAVQQPLEARSAPEESSQRLTTWKTRKPSVSEQERPLVREKVVGDREPTTHWAQRWVPVEHKSGGASGKGSSAHSSSGNVRPVNGNRTESHEPQHDYVISKDVAGTGAGSIRGEIPSSSSQSEVPPSSTSPSKSLRRLQTFPSDNMNIMLRVSASKAGAFETRESVASLANERLCGYSEHQANLRGLLPRIRTVDNPSTQAALQSTPGDHSTPVQSPLPGEQKIKSMSDDRSTKGSNQPVMVKPMLSPAEEKSRKAARTILEAVQSSCRDRKAAEVAVREVGCPMAEFERVLGAVAPSFFPVLDSSVPISVLSKMESPCVSDRAIRSRECSIACDGDEFSICWCRLSHIPLNSIWQWFKEPSYYGVEVRAVDCKKVQKNGELEEEPFLAYFVPYLSGLQIFGYSSHGASRRLGELSSTKGNMDSPLSAQPKVFSGSDMLATLFPTPGKCDERSSHEAASCSTCEHKHCSLRERDTSGLELLYEFYDTDVPQVRQPLFTKVQELVEGISSINSYSRGRSTVLDELCLGDIHPASWFAVAWYPIYRISEAPLRATFLTYHSFDHFAPRSSLSCLMGEVADVDESISMPVVGLECYNVQGEPWLSMGGRFSEEATKASGRLTVNPTHCLENRISSLEAVAAGMAKGIPDEKSATSADDSSGVSNFRHSDYEFFVKRRR